MLKLSVVCIGRTKAGPERDLTSRYLDRARLAGRPLGVAVSLQEITESPARRPDDRKADEVRALRAAVPSGTTLVVFDERGRSATSQDIANIVQGARDAGQDLSLVIGGPDGLETGLRDEAADVIALGAMTWPHQLARIMVVEQVYRAMTILSGHPYHRA